MSRRKGSGNATVIWPSFEQLVQASEQSQPDSNAERQRLGSVKTAQGRYDEYETINPNSSVRKAVMGSPARGNNDLWCAPL